jgi:hypothetical protein
MNFAGVTTGLIFIAIGAILAIAVDARVAGLDIVAVGIILMGVGVFAILFSLLVLASLSNRGADHIHGPEQGHGHGDHL